jgi:DNA-binding NarL/FixJ family response regulator
MEVKEMEESIRVLLADDHPLVRAGIRTTLNADGSVTLVGEATNGYEAQHLGKELRPQVLLLDLNMPGPKPTQTVAYLREHCPEVRVVALTAYDDDAYVRGLVSAGVAGYVLKDEATDTVMRAIHAVVQGDTWFSRHIVERLARIGDKQSSDGNLTDRERELLEMVAQGLDNAHIGAKLSLADQTVRNYLSRIYTKLGVNSRAEAIVWARERGMARD